MILLPFEPTSHPSFCCSWGGRTGRRAAAIPALLLAAFAIAGCSTPPPRTSARVSGQVETTQVQVAPQVAGRLVELHVQEGDRVAVGDLIARLDTRDTELAITRARAELDQAEAQLRLLQAGSRIEDIRQAEAQASGARADIAGADAEMAAAQVDVDRFEALLQAAAGSRKQRDDAVTRRDLARERVRGLRDRARAADELVARLRSGARREEIEAARARVRATAAQIATLQKAVDDATISASSSGTVTEKLVEVGELVQVRTPIVIISDLDRPWANVYVDEPDVPRIALGQAATIFTDAGGVGIAGKVSYISPRAEFTPRNVQTADERSKLVYRIKVSADNRSGVLKQGMPVEADVPLQTGSGPAPAAPKGDPRD
jgi:HlyD family secretion protein